MPTHSCVRIVKEDFLCYDVSLLLTVAKINWLFIGFNLVSISSESYTRNITEVFA